MSSNQSTGVRPIEIAFLVIVIGFISLFAGEYRPVTKSVETLFADASMQGLMIVPASCPSDPHVSYECSCPTAIEGGWDAYGRILYGGYTGRMINFNGVFKCVSNGTGSHYFVPAGDNAQTQSFINAAPGIGVSVFDPY